jgi:hypothetical protein
MPNNTTPAQLLHLYKANQPESKIDIPPGYFGYLAQYIFRECVPDAVNV